MILAEDYASNALQEGNTSNSQGPAAFHALNNISNGLGGGVGLSNDPTREQTTKDFSGANNSRRRGANILNETHDSYS